MWASTGAGYDDSLFVAHANALLHHQWLGPFTNLTLFKGPAYPFFLALSHVAGLPILISQQLLHLLAAAVAGYTLSRLTSRTALGLGAFTIVALDPSFLGVFAGHPGRDSFYTSVCLLLFSMTALAGTAAWPRRRIARRDAPSIVLMGGAIGVVLVTYWLTREERVWMLPSLAVIVVGTLARWWRSRMQAAASRGLAIGVVTLLVAGVAYSMVAERNRRAYGAFLVDDYVDGAFSGVWGRWQSVEAGPGRRYVSIGRAQRQAVYAVSPAARELQPTMEGPGLAYWASVSCTYVAVCDDVGAGWTMILLRDAVAAAGHYRTAHDAQVFYRRLEREIAAACRRRALRCARPMPAMLPRPAQFDTAAFLKSARTMSRLLLGFHLASQARPASAGDAAGWELYRLTIRGLPKTLAAHQAHETAWQRGRAVARLDRLRRVYARGTLVFLPVALAGYVVALKKRRPGWAGAWIFGAGAGVAVVSRIALVSLLDSTSFPGVPHILPAASFLIVFMFVGAWLLIHATARPFGYRRSERGAWEHQTTSTQQSDMR
jgi:hypothetical protein